MATRQNVPQALSAEQVKAILKEARQHSTRDWCLLLLTFRHALRSQEARTLKLADIDLENSTIAIARVSARTSSRMGSAPRTGGGRLPNPVSLPEGRSHDPDAVS
jgi:integrase